jgi:hypothetical protein
MRCKGLPDHLTNLDRQRFPESVHLALIPPLLGLHLHLGCEKRTSVSNHASG